VIDYIKAELKKDIRYTVAELEKAAKRVGVSRDDVRRAVHLAESSKRLGREPLLDAEKKGGRDYYLIPIVDILNPPGAREVEK
jgi:hypothetical protein